GPSRRSGFRPRSLGGGMPIVSSTAGLRRVPPVLVTGATGRIGRVVIDLLIDAGVPVRALTHRSEAAATLPANVEVVTGDLTLPQSPDTTLRSVGTVLLVWTPAATTGPAVVQ